MTRASSPGRRGDRYPDMFGEALGVLSARLFVHLLQGSSEIFRGVVAEFLFESRWIREFSGVSAREHGVEGLMAAKGVQQREEVRLVRQDKKAHETLRFVVKSFNPIGGGMGHGHQRGERNKILRGDRLRVRFSHITAGALVTGVRPLGNILRKSFIQPTRNAVWVKSMKSQMNDFVSEAVVGEFISRIAYDEEASG